MAASAADISRWFDEGLAKGAAHMAIICDTFDWDDFPRYYMPGEKPPARDATLGNMEKLMEVYALRQPKAAQMAEHRSFNYDPA